MSKGRNNNHVYAHGTLAITPAEVIGVQTNQTQGKRSLEGCEDIETEEGGRSSIIPISYPFLRRQLLPIHCSWSHEFLEHAVWALHSLAFAKLLQFRITLHVAGLVNCISLQFSSLSRLGMLLGNWLGLGLLGP